MGIKNNGKRRSKKPRCLPASKKKPLGSRVVNKKKAATATTKIISGKLLRTLIPEQKNRNPVYTPIAIEFIPLKKGTVTITTDNSAK
jgi:hypothetical protein